MLRVPAFWLTSANKTEAAAVATCPLVMLRQVTNEPPSAFVCSFCSTVTITAPTEATASTEINVYKNDEGVYSNNSTNSVYNVTLRMSWSCFNSPLRYFLRRMRLSDDPTSNRDGFPLVTIFATIPPYRTSLSAYVFVHRHVVDWLNSFEKKSSTTSIYIFFSSSKFFCRYIVMLWRLTCQVGWCCYACGR